MIGRALEITAKILFMAASSRLFASEVATEVYKHAAPAVFRVVLRDGKGEPVSLGSGFLIQGHELVTNLHVVRDGSPYLSLGSVSVPAHVEKTDAVNDLAILKVDVDIDAVPLRLSTSEPLTGTSVYAIGNPEGLDKSLSTGVVAATRHMEDRELLQITAPISHGSSGGPVLNAAGEVVGVSVGMLEDGQNLNFAIPASKVQALLLNSAKTGHDLSGLLNQVKQLEEQAKGQEGEAYNATSQRIVSVLRQAAEVVGSNPKDLLAISEAASFRDPDLSITTAARAVQLKSNTESNCGFGKALQMAELVSFLQSGAHDTTLLQRAKSAFELALRQANGSPPSDLLSSFASVLEDLAFLPAAESNFRRALEISTRSSSQQEIVTSLRGLIRVTYNQNHLSDSDKWFAQLDKQGLAEAWDWSGYGKRKLDQELYAQAGSAYARAANLGGGWMNFCDAADAYWRSSDSQDIALSWARSCISNGTGKEKSEPTLAWAHDFIADILNGRGVYTEALTHVREAVTLDSTQAWFFETEAEALRGLQRPSEAISAANQALRLSDGKYSTMHFTLGSAYFDEENWTLALQSFEKAANLDPRDGDAAYNVALCNLKLGYRIDAVRWFQEVLRRNPNHPKRESIGREISALNAGFY